MSAVHHRATPVRGPDGQIYPSQAAVARAFGVHPGTVFYHIDRYGDLSRIGKGHGTPVVWRGKTYANAVEAANDAGVNSAAAYYQLRVRGDLERLGSGRRGVPGNPAKSKPVTIGGHSWPSREKMARDLKIKRRTLANWLQPGASQQQRDKLMAAVMAHEARSFQKIGR